MDLDELLNSTNDRQRHALDAMIFTLEQDTLFLRGIRDAMDDRLKARTGRNGHFVPFDPQVHAAPLPKGRRAIRTSEMIRLRELKGLKAYQAANLADISSSYYSNIESGYAKTVSAEVLERVAAALDVTVDAILEPAVEGSFRLRCDEIRRLREEKGLSQVECSKRLGTSESYWSNIENGRYNAGKELVLNIAAILEVEVDAIQELTVTS